MFRHSIVSIAVAASLGAIAAPVAAADFTLTSPDVAEGTSIRPAQYWNSFGCTGENMRPALNWVNSPEGTKSFAVTFYDKDAPTGSGLWHWVAYNIPASATGVDGKSLPAGAVEGNTDLGQPGFFGPCPPVGRKHTYAYTVHALKTDKLEIPAGATAPLTGFFLYQNTIATATLSVTAGPRE